MALVIMAATEPVAGNRPSGLGPVASGLVAKNRDPASTRRHAVVIDSNDQVRCSPKMT